eukprot:TRINITY_DN4879_c0_g2_i1.p1 TRINITY_DN4879_c0_g2~~TRINITY_DN4879_c0_g2_i1.p1  ORF type:complete len:415 (-),score=41.51 TRINITY_DN4879_c0_g2_i1:105-1274(-)
MKTVISQQKSKSQETQTRNTQNQQQSIFNRRAAMLAVPTLIQSLSLTQIVQAEQLPGSYQSQPNPLPHPQLQTTNYDEAGPYTPARLPLLEHICANCFPDCNGNQCLLRIEVYYPGKNNQFPNKSNRPFPLAIVSGGFLVGREEYVSYAERLASWGYVAIVYDKLETVTETLGDVASSCFINDLIDWAETDPLLSVIADPAHTYLVGHSRGGKLSVLAAVRDPRVYAVCLIDPVDNTKYAPLSSRFPSAINAIQTMRPIPMALIGAGKAGDCVPPEANYKRFFAANSVGSPTWEVVVKNVGHFQFLDRQTSLFRSVCAQGNGSDIALRKLTQTMMVVWGNYVLSMRSLNQFQQSNQTDSDLARDVFRIQGVIDEFKPQLDLEQVLRVQF